MRESSGIGIFWHCVVLGMREVALAPLRMLPNAHTIPYHALDHADIVGALGGVVRYPPQRTRAFSSLRRYYDTALIVLYLLAWLLEQFRVYSRWERPWWAA